MVSHHRVLGLVGQGGMGSVYLAEDTKLHRRVALKFMTGDPACRPRLPGTGFAVRVASWTILPAHV